MSRNASETRTPSPQQLATPQIFLDSDPISAKENLCIGLDLTSQIYHTWRTYHWQSPSSFLVGVIRHVAVTPQSSPLPRSLSSPVLRKHSTRSPHSCCCVAYLREEALEATRRNLTKSTFKLHAPLSLSLLPSYQPASASPPLPASADRNSALLYPPHLSLLPLFLYYTNDLFFIL